MNFNFDKNDLYEPKQMIEMNNVKTKKTLQKSTKEEDVIQVLIIRIKAQVFIRPMKM